MKVVSVNIGERKKITWKFKTVETGIYKYAVDKPIFLELEDVKNDDVVDRKYHGGNDKAVYMYSKSNYAYFQKLYPKLDFYNGFFGENITIDKLSENEIFIGDIFKIGDAIIQVSQPRFPCFKLGIVFNNHEIIKQFLNSPFSGFYFRVLKKGSVKKNDSMVLIEKATNSMTVAEIFSIYTINKGNNPFIEKALSLEFLAKKCKLSLRKRML